ncbi:MAG: biotin synthase BioB [Thermodesulfovibrionales bacterium]
MLQSLAHKAARGMALSREEGLFISGLGDREAFELFAAADKVRRSMRGGRVDLCSIVSAKTGACQEDCSYCAQSRVSAAGVEAHPLLGREEVLGRARAARAQGARRFCVVTSGKRATASELREIAAMVGAIREEGLLPCATLGLLGKEELSMLRDAGLERYHHNLETSREHFPRICTTHTYDDKLRTIGAAREAGLSVCSGGIFGLGEGWGDRVSMAMELRGLGADSVPVNFLVPVRGTPLGDEEPLGPLEALRIISLMRFMLPDREIRVCGGRLQTLGELNALVFAAGADGLLTGDCLTTRGRSPEDDLRMIAALGLTV